MIIRLDRIDGRQSKPRQIADTIENCADKPSQLWRAGKIGAIAGHVDTGQDHFTVAVPDKALDLLDNDTHGNRARIASTKRDYAKRATMITAILHLHKRPRPTLNRIDQVACGLTHAHDIVDAHLLCVIDAEIRQCPVVVCSQFLLIAEHEIDLSHRGEIIRRRLRGTAGDDNARIRLFTPRLADRLARLPYRLCGHRAGIDDYRAAFQSIKFCLAGLIADYLGFVGVEPATECQDIDRHHAAPASSRLHAPVAGSNAPENSHSAGPVMIT